MNCEDFIKEHPSKKQFLVYAVSTPSENGKKFTIVLPKGNKEEFLRIKIDKGLLNEIDQLTKKCDYGFIRGKTCDYYFVELKGADINSAVEQLISTIKYFKKEYHLESKNTYAFVVSSGLPASANLKFLKLVERFKKEKIGIELKKQTNHYKHIVK